jgi:alpha-tubulin suppressor-like RCC1 family protein
LIQSKGIDPKLNLPLVGLLTLLSLHSAALAQSTTVLAWGDGRWGQTNVPLSLTNVVGIAAGWYHTLALRRDGTLAAWGTNDYGQSTVPAGLSNVVAIAAGGYHNLALTADGTLAGWGRNDFGQSTIPAAASNVVAVAAGDLHSVVLRANGTVFAWGCGSVDQTNLSSAATNRVIAIAAAGNVTAALLSDSTVKAWGFNGYSAPTPPTGLSNVVAIAAGANNCAALTANGTVVIWGNRYDISASIPSAATNGIARVAMGGQCGMVLRNNGTITAWGNPTYLQTSVPANATNSFLVAAGGTHSVAVADGGAPHITCRPQSVSAYLGTSATFTALATGQSPLSLHWFYNESSIAGASSNTFTLQNVLPNSGGEFWMVASNCLGTDQAMATLTVLDHLPIIRQQPASLAVSRGLPSLLSVRSEGSLPMTFQWQRHDTNLAGATDSVLQFSGTQPPQGGVYQVVVSNHLGQVTSATALLEVSSVVDWSVVPPGYNTLPLGLTNVVDVACGYEHSAALTADGRVVVWGYYSLSSTTAQPTDLTNAVAIAAGYDHDLALRRDGTVAAWGTDYSYQGIRVGQATVPAGLSGVVAISGGGWFSLALKSDGTVIGWGKTNAGQLYNPGALNHIVAISAGEEHALFLKDNGTVIAQGANNYGQTPAPAGLSNVIAIAAGNRFSMALQADGHLVFWGSQNNPGSGVSNVVAIAAGPLALKADGTVISWVYNMPSPPPVGVVGIAATWIRAAFLLGDSVNASSFAISGAERSQNSFSASVPTVCGRPYFLECSDALSPVQWRPVMGVAGDGTTKALLDAAPPGGNRFYRVVR